ncbi:RDD family protein [Stenotrophomonas sp.]|uniref:RDD family protein n=1 Tax=Stenotrophomonas sp. TaxID=69392 RepID=UPI0028A95BE3|nr:RDD family protein [Stenotrophomonas sp.]
MTEWYYADGQDRQGPLMAEELRQRFQRGEISLTTLVWREGYGEWKALSEAVEELQLQNLTSAASNLGSGFDLRGDYTAIDNGTAPLPGTGGGTYSPYTAPGATGSYGSSVVSGGEVVYAGFWKRVAAYLVDYVLLTVTSAIVGGIIGAVLGVAMSSGGSSGSAIEMAAQGVGMLLGIGIGVAYYAAFHSSKGGATLGKMVVGIKVVRSDGERISVLRAIGRYFAAMLSGLILCIGYLMAAFTDRKQTLHDMICDTVVVDRWAFTEQSHLQRHELGTATVVILVIAGLLTVGLIGLMIAMFGVIAASMS